MNGQPILSEWVYVEQDSRYTIPARVVAGGRIALLGELVRAVGTLAGTVTPSGGVEVDGREYPVDLVRGGSLPPAGEQIRFSFWPTLPVMPSNRIRKTPLPTLTISRIMKSNRYGDVGRVEIVGRLTRLFNDGCLVELPARRGAVYYVPVVGDVYADEVGKWLTITARWEAGKVMLVDSVPVAWCDYYRSGEPLHHDSAVQAVPDAVATVASVAAVE